MSAMCGTQSTPEVRPMSHVTGRTTIDVPYCFMWQFKKRFKKKSYEILCNILLVIDFSKYQNILDVFPKE